jgi:hypothetical protein
LNRLREEVFLCDSVILARIAFQACSSSHIFHLRQARSGCYPLVTLTPSAFRPCRERVRDLLRTKWGDVGLATQHRAQRQRPRRILPTGSSLQPRAIACKAPRHPWHPWHLPQRRHFRICNLHNLEDRVGLESHPLRQLPRYARSFAVEAVSFWFQQLSWREIDLRVIGAAEADRHVLFRSNA